MKKSKLSEKYYDNPINWINKNIYLSQSKMKKDEVKANLLNLLSENAKKMISKHKFGNIFSGGIDSTLQSVLINQFKKPSEVSVLNFLKKDKITKNIYNFKKYVNFSIKRLDIDKNKFIKEFKTCYNITGFPFLTHDFVGKFIISKYFKTKRCKVFFGADGVDELFGEFYKKTNWNRILIRLLIQILNLM